MNILDSYDILLKIANADGTMGYLRKITKEAIGVDAMADNQERMYAQMACHLTIILLFRIGATEEEVLEKIAALPALLVTMNEEVKKQEK